MKRTVHGRFFCTYCIYVHTYYIHRRGTDKTYASCWLARIAVGSLVLQCLRRTAITQITTTALRRTAITQITTTARVSDLGTSRKLKQEGIKATGRGIAKFLAKFIESGSVARKWKTVEGDSRGSDLGYTRPRDDSAKI